MKKQLIPLIVLVMVSLLVQAQPRIKQRDIVGLSDSLMNRFTKAQVIYRLLLKVDQSDPRLVNSRPASDVYPWAKAPEKPVYTPLEIGAAATGHSHSQSQVTGLTDALNNRLTKAQADILYEPFGGASGGGGGLSDSLALYNLVNAKVDTTDYRLTNERPASDVYPWAKAPLKPAYSFTEIGAAPASHVHGQIQVTDLPDSLLNHYTKAQVNYRLLGKVNTSDGRLSDARIALDVYPWAKTSVKPTYTYTEVGAAPLSHTQAQTTITGLGDSLLNHYTKAQANARLNLKVDLTDARLTNSRPASDVYPWAKAVAKPSYSYTEVGAAPLSHTQAQSTITALPDSLTVKYTRAQADRRYYRKTDSEEATQYFYTKAQVMQIVDSVKQTILDYINAQP